MNETRPLNAQIWARDEHDWYVEPRWTSERLFDVEQFDGPIVDPACGLGRIVASAIKAGHIASGSDIVKRSAMCDHVADFMIDPALGAPNIVCNPPFKIARPFVAKALTVASRKVAMLLPLKWLAGDDRSRWLEGTPLARVWFITPRPSMPPGAVILAGQKPGGGKEDFIWLVWERGHEGPWTGAGLRKAP